MSLNSFAEYLYNQHIDEMMCDIFEEDYIGERDLYAQYDDPHECDADYQSEYNSPPLEFTVPMVYTVDYDPDIPF